MAWLAGLRWSAQVLSWLSLVFIANLLSPKDYGMVGLVSWFMIILGYVADFGIGTTVMARRDLSSSVIAQLNSVSILMGVLACGVTLLVAPLLASFYREPELVDVLSVFGATFLCTAFAVIPSAMMQRALSFRKLAILDFVRAISTTGTVLTLATLKFGFWALVIGNLAGAAIYALLALGLAAQPFHRPVWAVLRSPLQHGSYILTSGLAWAAYANSDFAVVGRVLGVTAVGYYSLAWTLATLPGEKITNVVQSVLRPLFAAIQHDVTASRTYFLVSNQLLCALLAPMFVGFALVAPDAIPIVLGTKWRPAVPVVQILCFYAISQNLSVMCSTVLFRKADVKRTAAQAVLLAVVLPPLFWFVSSRWGLLGIPITWLLIQPLIMIYPFRLMQRVLQIRAADYLARLLPVGVCSAAMALAVWTVSTSLTASAPLWRLFAEITLGALVYAAAWHLLYHDQMRTLWRLIRNRTLQP